jgi:hypothetical protein
MTKIGLFACAIGIFVIGFWSQIYEIIDAVTFAIVN